MDSLSAVGGVGGRIGAGIRSMFGGNKEYVSMMEDTGMKHSREL